MIQEEAFRCKNITEKLLDFSRCNDITRERDRPLGTDPGSGRHDPAHRQVSGEDDRLPPEGGPDGPRRRPGDQAGRAEPDRQRPGVDGPPGDPADRRPLPPGYGRDELRGRRLRHGRRGAGEHLRAVLHEATGGEGDGAGTLDHAPDHQPARRRDHGRQPGSRERVDVHGPAADPSGRDQRGWADEGQEVPIAGGRAGCRRS